MTVRVVNLPYTSGAAVLYPVAKIMCDFISELPTSTTGVHSNMIAWVAENGSFYTNNGSGSWQTNTAAGVNFWGPSLSNINVSAGGASNNLSALVFSNAVGGVSFGLNGSTVTASAPAAAPTPINFSAGGTSNNLGSVVFSNSNGVGFGLSGSTITASHNALTTAMASNRGSDFVQATAAFAGTSASGTINSAGISVSIGPYITTARASNDAIGLNTAATSVTWTVNSSGISLNAGAYLTTAAVSNHSHWVSFTSGSVAFQTLSFTNSNGISFNSGTQGIFGSHNAITTGALSDHSHGNPTLNLTNLSGTTASNSAGFTLSLSAAAAGGGDAIRGIAANGSTASTNTVHFSNANGVSFGFGAAGNSTVITASHNAITTGRASTDAIGLNTAQTNVTWTVNSSGLSLNAAGYAGTGTSATNASVTLNSNGLAISVAAPGGGAGATMSTYHNHPINILTTIGAPANNSATIQFLPLREALTATRLEVPVSVSIASAANNSSGAILYTLSAWLYTKNANTLNTVSSGSGAGTHTWSSNATGSISGGRIFSAALNVNAAPGNYFVGLHLSTRATGHAGPGSTSLGNTLNMFGVGTAMAGAVTFGDFNANTASSQGWYTVGLNSSTGNMTQVSLSNVTQAGSGFQRANIALRLFA